MCCLAGALPDFPLRVRGVCRQWAHTFLSLKFLYYAVAFDGLEDSAWALFFCLIYSLCVLDWFKNVDGVGAFKWRSCAVHLCDVCARYVCDRKVDWPGIGTLTNSYFIYRMTQGLVCICVSTLFACRRVRGCA